MKRPTPPLHAVAPYKREHLGPDLSAAATVLFLAVPQGLAYATIAGLPPAMGLYASAVPTIVGSLFRSSRHVLSGPTNALSLLVGGATAVALGGDPVGVVITLALMVGVFQLVAGLMRLGALVDYISNAVVLGYITGAAVLIGIGQLHNVTATTGPGGPGWSTIAGWIEGLRGADAFSVAIAAGTIAIIVMIRALERRTQRRLPGAMVAMVLAIALDYAVDLSRFGLRVIGDLSPIPPGLPPLTVPSLEFAVPLLPAAIACAMLSLVESTSVARTIAQRTGQALDASTEFVGQGLSNISAAFFGGFPVSGSLTRSSLNERAGGKGRVAGVVGGVLMLGVLVAFASALDHTPLASLAGLLLVVATDLVDLPRIRRTFRASPADGMALITTMLGTWTLPLDTAIYLGVGISLVLFLRQARFLTGRELMVGKDGGLRELGPGNDAEASSELASRCERIRFLHLEGSLFFGSAGELTAALNEATCDPKVKVLIVRLKHTQGLDATSAEALEAIAERLRADDRQLLLVGMAPATMAVLERSGAAERLGRENIFPSQERWFAALDAARSRALALCGDDCARCPFARASFGAGPLPKPNARA